MAPCSPYDADVLTKRGHERREHDLETEGRKRPRHRRASILLGSRTREHVAPHPRPRRGTAAGLRRPLVRPPDHARARASGTEAGADARARRASPRRPRPRGSGDSPSRRGLPRRGRRGPARKRRGLPACARGRDGRRPAGALRASRRNVPETIRDGTYDTADSKSRATSGSFRRSAMSPGCSFAIRAAAFSCATTSAPFAAKYAAPSAWSVW